VCCCCWRLAFRCCCPQGRSGKTGIATTFVNSRQCSESILLDLKHLLKEAKQRVPHFLTVRVVSCCIMMTTMSLAVGTVFWPDLCVMLLVLCCTPL
jgi:hypothetical protein